MYLIVTNNTEQKYTGIIGAFDPGHTITYAEDRFHEIKMHLEGFECKSPLDFDFSFAPEPHLAGRTPTQEEVLEYINNGRVVEVISLAEETTPDEEEEKKDEEESSTPNPPANDATTGDTTDNKEATLSTDKPASRRR